MSDTILPAVLAWCRPGFESETAQELAALAERHDAAGYARTERGCGYVEFVAGSPAAADRIVERTPWRTLCFPRQLLRATARIEALPPRDRIGALLPAIVATGRRFADVWVEAADSDAGRELAPLCRALNAALVGALRRENLLERDAADRLHIGFVRSDAAFVAHARVALAAPWPGGIPRLRFPSAAPSRSTLKLEEAFLTLLDDGERERWLRAGMSAVDLGAAPGGWTYQLVRRSIRVTAIDNGPMAPSLMETGLVTHQREDGFRYRPPRPVDWLVCDMVEQPRRVAARMAEWLAGGWCRYAIFNLKLPMKKRHEEVRLCLDLLAERCASAGRRLDLRSRQLYHDREEVTVFARCA